MRDDAARHHVGAVADPRRVMADGRGGDAEFVQVVEPANPGTIAADSGIVENRRGGTQLRREIGGIDAAMRRVDDDRAGGFRPDAGDAVGDDDRSGHFRPHAACDLRPWSTSRIPAMIRLRSGKTAFSRIGLYGIGTCNAQTRLTGLLRLANVARSSVAIAAISAEKPAVGPASSAMTSRPVFCTEPRIVSLSSGTSVRGSTISTEMPSLASSSAAASASCTSQASATTVTSAPSLLMSAWPNGIV